MRSGNEISKMDWRILFGITIIFLAALGIIVASQAVTDSQLMAKSLIPCCDNAMCQNDWFNCDMESSAFVKPNCSTSVSITCRQCVDLTIRGRICIGGSYYCYELDGSKYFGIPWKK